MDRCATEMFAPRTLRRAELIKAELPLVALQSVGNSLLSCAHCLRIVGSLNTQLQHYAGEITHEEACAPDECAEERASLPDLPGLSESFSDDVVRCPTCTELYCSGTSSLTSSPLTNIFSFSNRGVPRRSTHTRPRLTLC
jgi:hypothetical protein